MVVVDDAALDVGRVRFRPEGSPGGHNGLRDTMAALGSRDFFRLRIGIDHPQDRGEVVDYVLSRPSREDAQAIDRALEAAADPRRYMQSLQAAGYATDPAYADKIQRILDSEPVRQIKRQMKEGTTSA